jgi:predicted GNAT family acetyltransferase
MTTNSISPEPPVIHNTSENRFEISMDGALAVLEYTLEGEKIIFTHTGVPMALEGQGMASRLARFALDFARAQRLKVEPLCSFIAGYIHKHPEYADLLV